MAVLLPLGLIVVATWTAFVAAQSYTAPRTRKCPDGRPPVKCKAAPCEVTQCPRYQNATCVDDYCGGCFARYFVNGKEVTKYCPSSPPVCPDGSNPFLCFEQPCRVSSCPAFPNATCIDDFCGGCNARFFVDKQEVTNTCQVTRKQQCPDDRPQVQCVVAPCSVSTCPRYPNATCVDDYCGGCLARYFVNGKEVTSYCPSSPPVCPDGSRPVQCFQRPCDATKCQGFPSATCVDDYCGGCNAWFYINKTEVTNQCCTNPPVTQCREEEKFRCLIDPCDSRFTSCNNVPTAACTADLCVGCVDRWFLPDCHEVTSACNKTAPAN